MFDKFKDMVHATEHVDKLNDKFEELIQTVETHTEAVKSLKTEIDALKDSQGKLVERVKQDAHEFSTIKEDLRKEIVDFKIIKSKLEKSMIDSFEEQIKTELIPKFSRLETHVKRFEELGEQVRAIGSRVTKLSEEIAKFTEISSNIKKADFDLVNHARQLHEMDQEKLRLMQRIDTLEKMIGKMRRN